MGIAHSRKVLCMFYENISKILQQSTVKRSDRPVAKLIGDIGPTHIENRGHCTEIGGYFGSTHWKCT